MNFRLCGNAFSLYLFRKAALGGTLYQAPCCLWDADCSVHELKLNQIACLPVDETEAGGWVFLRLAPFYFFCVLACNTAEVQLTA